jgi:antirestriction protein ArdC
MHPKTNIYEQITSVILEAIEKGCEEFQMPWHSTLSLPCNAESGRLYRGVNVLALWAMTQRFHYATNLWATYQQWSQMGAQVRRGAKSATVVFWNLTDGEPNDRVDNTSATSSPISHCFAKAYHVFNADRISMPG